MAARATAGPHERGGVKSRGQGNTERVSIDTDKLQWRFWSRGPGINMGGRESAGVGGRKKKRQISMGHECSRMLSRCREELHTQPLQHVPRHRLLFFCFFLFCNNVTHGDDDGDEKKH